MNKAFLHLLPTFMIYRSGDGERKCGNSKYHQICNGTKLAQNEEYPCLICILKSFFRPIPRFQEPFSPLADVELHVSAEAIQINLSYSKLTVGYYNVTSFSASVCFKKSSH